MDLYLFFAPPRSGNHFIEMVIGGLYYNYPVICFEPGGQWIGPEKVVTQQDIAPYLPPLTKRNPFLFLEKDLPSTREMRNRGKELDLNLVRSLVHGQETSGDQTVLCIQWCHGCYHALPYPVVSPKDINVKYCFVKRCPQDIEFSHYQVLKNRWGNCNFRRFLSKKPGDRLRSFSEFYDQAFLLGLLKWYETYNQIAEKFDSFTFEFESLKSSSEPLMDFVDFVGREPKLRPDSVWERSKLSKLSQKTMNRTFYRKGKSLSWLEELSEAEIERMKEVERFVDFTKFGYPSTDEILTARNK